jgi:hypothetical protein
MNLKRCLFSNTAILVTVIVLAVLVAVLVPILSDNNGKTRFENWLKANEQHSKDPTCIINYNFQDGEGRQVKNSANGFKGKEFKAESYNGVVKGDCLWGQGRWHRNKKALQFDGVSTYVEVPEVKHVDFDNNDNFTIIVWLKFDRLRKWDGVFGKCYMRDANSGYNQYNIYFDGNIYNSEDKTDVQFNVDVSTLCETFSYPEENTASVKLDTKNWFQLTLRNKQAGGKQEIDVFFNSTKLKSRDAKIIVYKRGKCTAKLVLGCIRWLIREYDASNVGYKPTVDGRLSNFFKGKIDEFLVYNRALGDKEIEDYYQIGAEQL